MFQVSTSAGWDGVLAGLMNDDCNSSATEDRPTGDCGNSGLAVMYLVTYLVITFLVVINMYIAVILENFSQVYSFPPAENILPTTLRILSALVHCPLLVEVETRTKILMSAF